MKKRFFAKHAKSSAALVSLAVHAVLIVVAISFVAVQVVRKEEMEFETKTVSRPKMPLKKLQLPVNIKKKRAPRLRKRIVVQPKMNTAMPDIKMPEISGVKGGLGNAGSGLGGAGDIGFSMPEFELFGIKGKGEKVFIILDSTPWMMGPERGGIAAYRLIKEELVRILGNLNSTVLLNVAVYGHGGGSYVLFPKAVPATAPNLAKIEAWLQPLNALEAGGYGTHTLGPGGTRIQGDFVVEPLKNINHWTEPMMYAMQQQMDTIFLLASGWGHLRHDTAPAKPWSEEKRAKYRTIQKKARAKLEEENRKLKEAGKSPFALVGPAVIERYFPGTQHPPQPTRYWYTPKELERAFITMRKTYAAGIPQTSGLGKRSRKEKDKFSFNVIQFIPQTDGKREERFKQMSGLLRGDYRSIPGLEAIERYIASGDKQ